MIWLSFSVSHPAQHTEGQSRQLFRGFGEIVVGPAGEDREKRGGDEALLVGLVPLGPQKWGEGILPGVLIQEIDHVLPQQEE